jgi:ArsR family transcriptional regulator
MPSLDATIELLHLFGDPTRVRLVALLAHHPLTVAELTTITELAQSRVSTHLGKLRDAGVVRDRRNGASTVYALNDVAMPGEARRVWTLLEDAVDDALLEGDRVRAGALVRARERRGSWPDAVAGQMERHYSPGRTWEATARAFIGLVRLGDVLDAGSGDGTIAQLLAPRARTITCLDRSEKMSSAARERLRGVDHVRFVRADLHAIPAPDDRFDQALLFNVLTHVATPAGALAEAARVLRPGGELVLVTLEAHRHLAITRTYGHVHAGFRSAWLRAQLGRSGLAVEHCEVTSRERREPHFNVITAFARKPARRSGRAT